MDVLRLIPQLYYDLVSRVFPGSMTILAITLAVDFKLGSILAFVLAGAPQQSTLVLGLMVFIGAYMTGQLIAPLRDFLERQVAVRLFPAHFRVVRDTATAGGGYSTEISQFVRDELAYAMDRISQRSTTPTMSALSRCGSIGCWYTM